MLHKNSGMATMNVPNSMLQGSYRYDLTAIQFTTEIDSDDVQNALVKAVGRAFVNDLVAVFCRKYTVREQLIVQLFGVL